MMKRITLNRDYVAANWKCERSDYADWRNQTPGGGRDVYERLLALSVDAGTEQMNQALGFPTGNGWTTNRCQECGQNVPDYIQLGEEPDIESATVQVCLPCARKYADFIREHTSHE